MRSPLCLLCVTVAAAAIAGCGTAVPQTIPAGPTDTTASAPQTTTAPQPPQDVPHDPHALSQQGFKICQGVPADELRQRFSASSSDPVDIADAYARGFPTWARVPLAEGCYRGITGHGISSDTGSTP